ncbi:MAG: sortase [Bacilli bacterium]|nr:sortase [Bacilli bacterium]
MLSQAKQTHKIKLKKSQILLIGSFLVFIGLIIIFWNYFVKIRDEVYADLMVDIVLSSSTGDEEVSSVPVTNNLPADNKGGEQVQPQQEAPINYDQYLGVLEIPRIGLKRGFFDTNNYYNNIEYNVAVVKGSTMPDVPNGNLILMAHSGDAYISYFAYLFLLNVGDNAYITYQKKQYKFQIVNIYDVPKNGKVTINRNYNRTTLTLITCTKNNDQSQTVYIAELV